MRSKYLRLPSPVSGSVRLSARIASRLCWRLLISLFESVSRSSSALLVSRISRVDFTSVSTIALICSRSWRADSFWLARQAGIVARRHAERFGDQRHHVVDLADDARADLVDAVGGLDLGEIGFVDLLEIGFAQLAVARQRLVDDLVEGSDCIRWRRRTRSRNCGELRSAEATGSGPARLRRTPSCVRVRRAA